MNMMSPFFSKGRNYLLFCRYVFTKERFLLTLSLSIYTIILNTLSSPFLIYYVNEIAGFVIIDKKHSEPKIDFNMVQFFILRKFKGKDMGRNVAYQRFNKFLGTWEVMVIPYNDGAYHLWQSVISS